MDLHTLAVVVTYNRSHLLPGCLDALKAQTYPCHILIIDNASTDNTPQVAAPYLNEEIRYHRMAENAGGAGGFNVGMRMGVEAGYKYLWILDDDAYPEPTALEELLSAGQKVHNDFGFLCSAVLWKDGRECRMNRQKARKAFFEKIELLQYGILSIEQATFVSCFFKAETVKNLGLPIADFFIWGDDIEYTRRLAVRQQLPCYLVGKSIVVHHMASNSGSDISTDDPSRIGRYAYAYRNENYLYRQEGIKGVLYYCARCGLHLWRIWFKGKDHKLARSKVLIGSFFRGWGFNPEIEYISDTV